MPERSRLCLAFRRTRSTTFEPDGRATFRQDHAYRCVFRSAYSHSQARKTVKSRHRPASESPPGGRSTAPANPAHPLRATLSSPSAPQLPTTNSRPFGVIRNLQVSLIPRQAPSTNGISWATRDSRTGQAIIVSSMPLLLASVPPQLCRLPSHASSTKPTRTIHWNERPPCRPGPHLCSGTVNFPSPSHLSTTSRPLLAVPTLQVSPTTSHERGLSRTDGASAQRELPKSARPPSFSSVALPTPSRCPPPRLLTQNRCSVNEADGALYGNKRLVTRPSSPTPFQRPPSTTGSDCPHHGFHTRNGRYDRGSPRKRWQYACSYNPPGSSSLLVHIAYSRLIASIPTAQSSTHAPPWPGHLPLR